MAPFLEWGDYFCAVVVFDSLILFGHCVGALYTKARVTVLRHAGQGSPGWKVDPMISAITTHEACSLRGSPPHICVLVAIRSYFSPYATDGGRLFAILPLSRLP